VKLYAKIAISLQCLINGVALLKSTSPLNRITFNFTTDIGRASLTRDPSNLRMLRTFYPRRSLSRPAGPSANVFCAGVYSAGGGGASDWASQLFLTASPLVLDLNLVARLLPAAFHVDGW